jgi:DNA-3-methyladenine glycosylase II
MTPAYWKQAKAELAAADPIMADIIAAYPGELLQSRGDAFYTLARSIVGQQISVKAADAVWGRFEGFMFSSCGEQSERAGSHDHFSKDSVQSLCNSQNDGLLRECGLSRQKIAYLRNIAAHFEGNNVKNGFFEGFSDETAIDFLTEIKGVGRWTAEMFLMFHLLRSDVLPVDDIGLHNGIAKHYAINATEKRRKMAELVEIAEKWRPWRSVATWYLWRSLDPIPVAY